MLSLCLPDQLRLAPDPLNLYLGEIHGTEAHAVGNAYIPEITPL